MHVVILAGGYGTRLSEETAVRPKPMVEIGGKPILWHIMKLYSHHGLNDFIICCGYKASVIREYFASYRLHASDVTFDLQSDDVVVHSTVVEPWRVTVADTGEHTMTGGRLRRIARYLEGDTFCFTYGDCVSDLDVGRLIDSHRKQGALATLTAVQPPGRFGVVTFHEDEFAISGFAEKPDGDGGWINGGFFVLEREVIDLIADDGVAWEREPLEELARTGKLHAYRHRGYWQNMDSLRDKIILEQQWASGAPPWRVWQHD